MIKCSRKRSIIYIHSLRTRTMSRFRFGFVLGEFLFDYNQHLSVSPQRHGNRHVNEETIAKVAPVFATIHIF